MDLFGVGIWGLASWTRKWESAASGCTTQIKGNPYPPSTEIPTDVGSQGGWEWPVWPASLKAQPKIHKCTLCSRPPQHPSLPCSPLTLPSCYLTQMCHTPPSGTKSSLPHPRMTYQVLFCVLGRWGLGGVAGNPPSPPCLNTDGHRCQRPGVGSFLPRGRARDERGPVPYYLMASG